MVGVPPVAVSPGRESVCSRVEPDALAVTADTGARR